MDDALRNSLWSLLKLCCWDKFLYSGGPYGSVGYDLSDEDNKVHLILCQRLWYSYFKLPLDTLGDDWPEVLDILKKHFFSSKWYVVYDFIEFIVENYQRTDFRDKFIPACNSLFEREMSAYRFVDGVISPLTNEQEIAAIEQAAESELDAVSEHIQSALEKLSNKTKPDYRNSIKESISAVESFVKIALKDDKATLSKLLKKLQDDTGLHPALRKAMSNLYGYASDEGGIRHALTESNRVDFDDAKFMLVACSAFVNFVTGKLKSAQTG